MRKLRAFVLRLRGLFGTRRADDEFAAELETHVALHTDEASLRPHPHQKRQTGAHPSRRLQEQDHARPGGSASRLPFLEGLGHDVAYSIRVLRARIQGFALRHRFFTLALGIGANTALFSIVSSVLLNPLPVSSTGVNLSLFTKARPTLLRAPSPIRTFPRLATRQHKTLAAPRHRPPAAFHAHRNGRR